MRKYTIIAGVNGVGKTSLTGILNAETSDVCDEATFYDNENGFVAVAEYKNGEVLQIGNTQPQWLKALIEYMN